MGIFRFDTVSRSALGPTQPPIQWVPVALSLGVKLTTHFHLVPRSKNAWSYISTHPIRLHAWRLIKTQDVFMTKYLVNQRDNLMYLSLSFRNISEGLLFPVDLNGTNLTIQHFCRNFKLSFGPCLSRPNRHYLLLLLLLLLLLQILRITISCLLRFRLLSSTFNDAFPTACIT
jgi:hypothetical protein